MDLLIVADGHYYQTADGTVYVDSVYDYSFYSRYLLVFDRVYAVARIEKVDKEPKGKKVSNGEGVYFLALPAYRGPIQYAQKYIRIRKAVNEFCKMGDCAIFRIPAATSNVFLRPYKKTKKPFAVELVIDPWENFAPGSIDSVLRPVIRIAWTNLVKRTCLIANGTSYVTSHYLQEKYPCKAITKGDGFTSSYSSVELPDDSYALPRFYKNKKEWIISHVANSFSDYGKGHIPLMKAVSIVVSKGYDVKIMFIGDGPKMNEFKDKAKELRIDERVSFLGRLPSGQEVRKQVAKSDLFVFPTKAEGLPRCLLEAMAEGLPCLSSPTCGIPEILEEKYLFEYDDINGFADGIINFITKTETMSIASRTNLETAKKFSSSVLNKKRCDFYSDLAKCVLKAPK